MNILVQDDHGILRINNTHKNRFKPAGTIILIYYLKVPIGVGVATPFILAAIFGYLPILIYVVRPIETATIFRQIQ